MVKVVVEWADMVVVVVSTAVKAVAVSMVEWEEAVAVECTDGTRWDSVAVAVVDGMECNNNSTEMKNTTIMKMEEWAAEWADMDRWVEEWEADVVVVVVVEDSAAVAEWDKWEAEWAEDTNHTLLYSLNKFYIFEQIHN